MIYDNKTVTNPHEIADALNMHFCSIGERLVNKMPDLGTKYRRYLQEPTTESFYLSPVSKQDIIKEINKLKSNKAAGPDGIRPKLIMLCPDAFATALEVIFNNSITNAEYPLELKLAKVISIFKAGHTFIPDNYRPISLLNCFNKIFERLLHSKLISFIEQHQILFIHQYGFRKKAFHYFSLD